MKLELLRLRVDRQGTDTGQLLHTGNQAFTADQRLVWFKYGHTLCEAAWLSLLDTIPSYPCKTKAAGIIYWDFWGSIPYLPPPRDPIPVLRHYLMEYRYHGGETVTPDELYPILQHHLGYPPLTAYIRAGYYNPYYLHRQVK